MENLKIKFIKRDKQGKLLKGTISGDRVYICNITDTTTGMLYSGISYNKQPFTRKKAASIAFCKAIAKLNKNLTDRGYTREERKSFFSSVKLNSKVYL